MEWKITFISDTHSQQNKITKDLPGGDLIICSGDVTNIGEIHDCEKFFKWFNELSNYNHKVFIAGNHDFCFENDLDLMKEILEKYSDITYLHDSEISLTKDGESILLYGSPWQPEFFNWAFNLPRNGEELKVLWDKIPENVDILITHGPPFGYLDMINGQKVGCELLRERVDLIKPKINVFGHIHFSHGHYYNGHTHFFNASSLNERYRYANNPITVMWDSKINLITFENE